MNTLSLDGSMFYIAFIDDYTKMCWIYFIKLKYEVVGIFMKFKAWVETESGCKMQMIMFDNRAEYIF